MEWKIKRCSLSLKPILIYSRSFCHTICCHIFYPQIVIINSFIHSFIFTHVASKSHHLCDVLPLCIGIKYSYIGYGQIIQIIDLLFKSVCLANSNKKQLELNKCWRITIYWKASIFSITDCFWPLITPFFQLFSNWFCFNHAIQTRQACVTMLTRRILLR